jgi:hypothetical protein
MENELDSLDNLPNGELTEEQKMEEAKKEMMKLHLLADQLIAEAATKSNITIPDLNSLHTKYSLLLENKDEMDLIKYAVFLEINVKQLIIGKFLQDAALRQSPQNGDKEG